MTRRARRNPRLRSARQPVTWGQHPSGLPSSLRHLVAVLCHGHEAHPACRLPCSCQGCRLERRGS